MKTISLEVSNEFDRRLRVVAAQMDLNRSEFIRQALIEKLKEVEGSAGDNNITKQRGRQFA